MFGYPPSLAASTVSYKSGTYENNYKNQSDSGRVPFWTESLNPVTSQRLSAIHNSEIQGYPFPNLQQIIDEDSRNNSMSVGVEDDILLCIFNRGEKFGAAFYEVEEATLYVVSDRTDPNYQYGSYEFLRNLVRQVNPAHLIISAGQAKDMIEVVRQLCGLPVTEASINEMNKTSEKVRN